MRKTLIPVVVLALAAPLAVPPAGAQQDGHGSMGHGSTDHSGMSEGVHAEATVNSIEGDTVNVTHGPIPKIGWPAMTMDLKLLDGAEVGDVAAGDEATMMLEKGPDGMYAIRALEPKK